MFNLNPLHYVNNLLDVSPLGNAATELTHPNGLSNQVPASRTSNAPIAPVAPTGPAPSQIASNGYVGGGSSGGYAGGGGSTPSYSPDDIAYLNDQENALRSLLGRTDTGLNQGLTKLEDDYQGQVGSQTQAKDQALQDYADQRVDTNKGKLSAYDTINQNAGNGYRSLAQLIGRAAGTGSSAFRELLPDVVGKDTSSKRRAATETYAGNLSNIDKAQSKTELSFADVLADLAKQRRQGEDDLRSGIEGQKQNLLGQISTVQGQRAQAQGGGYDAVKAAQAPTQSAIDNSRNAVENFFNTFRTAYTPRQAQVATADLGKYNTDRSTVNAQNQGQTSEDPYSSLLRKRLQEQA